MEKIVSLLQKEEIGKIFTNEPLSKYTTMRIGGPADILVIPKNIEAVVTLINLLKDNELSWTVIGRGSNLIISDEGIRGVVIKIDEGLDHLTVEGTKVVVGAGYSVVKLATTLSRKGLAGLEFASGIPGNVGGAICMNAGAHGSEIEKITSKVHVLLKNGESIWMTKDELEFSYRTSWLQKNGGIVLEVELELNEADSKISSERMQKNKEYRKMTQPWNLPCAGSIFRNPLPEYAGKLIEEAGLKGYQLGGVQISPMHGNFIVNTGNGTAKDVRDLINYIQSVIKEKKGIDLQTEVKFI